jgi:hypothetical protein
MLELDRVGQVDRGGVEAHIDGLDSAGAGNPEQGRKREGRERRGGAKKCQKTSSEPDGRRKLAP